MYSLISGKYIKKYIWGGLMENYRTIDKFDMAMDLVSSELEDRVEVLDDLLDSAIRNVELSHSMDLNIGYIRKEDCFEREDHRQNLMCAERGLHTNYAIADRVIKKALDSYVERTGDEVTYSSLRFGLNPSGSPMGWAENMYRELSLEDREDAA